MVMIMLYNSAQSNTKDSNLQNSSLFFSMQSIFFKEILLFGEILTNFVFLFIHKS